MGPNGGNSRVVALYDENRFPELKDWSPRKLPKSKRLLIALGLLSALLCLRVSAEPIDIEVVLRTEPTGASVKRGHDYLGQSGQALRFRIDDESRTLKLLFELDGHRPTEHTIVVNDLIYRDVYPPAGQTPIVLLPKSVLGVLVLWLRRHPAFSVALLSGAVLLWVVWLARNRERRLLKAWLGRMDVLLEGSRGLNTPTGRDSIWDELLQLAEKLMPGEVSVAIPQAGDDYRLVGRKSNLIGQRPLKSLLERAEDTDGVLWIEDFEGASLDPPTGETRTALVALCRGGEKSGAILALAGTLGCFKSEHRELLALLAHQGSSALVHEAISEQLSHQEKQAAIGNMACGLAHELNNPLGALQLSVDSAVETLEFSPKAALKALGKASGAIARARTLNENFLRFTGESQDSPKSELDLGEVVQEVLESLENSISGLELDADLGRGYCVWGNEHDLEILITNLVLNAKDALSESQQKLLRLSLSRQGKDVILQLSDTGSGIAAEHKKRIFEPFFTTKPLGSGWGLGLSVCRELMTQHSGQIQVNSTPNGTCVVLTFPSHEVQE